MHRSRAGCPLAARVLREVLLPQRALLLLLREEAEDKRHADQDQTIAARYAQRSPSRNDCWAAAVI